MVDSSRFAWGGVEPREPCWRNRRNRAIGVAKNANARDFDKEIHRLPPQRRELVFRLRRQLAEGTYDVDSRLALAVSRMIDRVADERGDVLD